VGLFLFVFCQHVLVLGLRLHEVQRGKKRSFDSAFSGSSGAAGAGAGSSSFAATGGDHRAANGAPAAKRSGLAVSVAAAAATERIPRPPFSVLALWNNVNASGVLATGDLDPLRSHAEQAVRFFEQDAASGSVESMVYLGLASIHGIGVVAVNKMAGSRWFQKAADAGSAAGMRHLGQSYMLGRGVPLELEQAVDWYKKAASAAAGDAVAARLVGECYQGGIGVKADGKLAFEWFKKGAEGGDSSVMNTLGICYETGRGVGVPEKKLAFKWYLKAAQAGNVSAMNNVGYCYLNGEGVEGVDDMNWTLAVDWFNKGAKAGVADAMLNLGSCYQDGKGVAVDAKVAASWYRKGARLHLKRATEDGDAHAMYKIGDCLDRGARGVPKTGRPR
jgi:TPR repeat protein